MKDINDPLQIVYIASHGHSGSTLLAQLLGSHSGIFSTGEICNISLLKQPCTCGVSEVGNCEFWKSVESFLLESDQLRLQDLDINSENTEVFKLHNLALYRAINKVSNCGILVDSSKNLLRLSRLKEIAQLTVCPIYLHRNPGGVLYSNLKKNRNWLPSVIGQYCSAYLMNGFFNTNSHVSVVYENLAKNPRREMSRLMLGFDLNLEADQLNWVKSSERHDIGGNRMRFRESSSIAVDIEWENALSTTQKKVIQFLFSEYILNNALSFWVMKILLKIL